MQSKDLKRQYLNSLYQIAPNKSLFAFAYKYRGVTVPDPWKPEKVHHFLCTKIQDAIENYKRIIISVPPQHGKSQIASVYAPAWYIMNNPLKTVGVISYSSDLAEVKSYQCRSLIQESFSKLSKDSYSRKNWGINKDSVFNYIARGVGGSITGNTIDLLVMDDLIKNHEEAESATQRQKIWSYIESTVITRLSKKSTVIVIATRWHMDDYIAKMGKLWKWPVYNIPAICDTDSDVLGREKGEVAAPNLKPKQFILDIKKDLSPYVFNALYQGRPITSETARIKREWFKYYSEDMIGTIKEHYNIYQTIDTAATDNEKSDYFVILTFAIVTTVDDIIVTSEDHYRHLVKEGKPRKNIYVLDVMRNKFETTEHLALLRLYHEKWNPVYQYVENITFGINILQAGLKDGLPLLPLKADRSKFLRSERIVTYYSGGQVHHLEGAPWLEDYEEEITNFPVAPHDDQFDCISYAGIIASEKMK